jgi:hypothetical protein
VLPPVIFQQQPIDTTGGTKVQGALRASLVKANDDDASSESELDSDEDMEGDYTHKLRQILHAIRLK